MIDMHLINVAMAGLGISAGAAILIAAVIIALTAVMRRKPISRRHRAARPATPNHGSARRRELVLR